MKKFSQKTEEGILVVAAMFVLGSSMIDPLISSIIAICSLGAFLGYNFLAKGA